jgi:hypothetical protein
MEDRGNLLQYGLARQALAVKGCAAPCLLDIVGARGGRQGRAGTLVSLKRCPGWRSLRRAARHRPQRPHRDLAPPQTGRGVDEIWGTFPARSAARVAVQARPNIGEVRRTVVVVVVAMRIAFRRRNGPRFGAQQRHGGQESSR